MSSVSYDAATIRDKVRAAGVVGAGGAGFPAYVKLQASAEIYLVNAAECEPLLKVDQQLMVSEAALMIRGLQYSMAATGAKEGIIALKAKYAEAIAALTPLLPSNIRIHILKDIYPAGDEVITIWMATGRRVPPGGIPLHIGVVVSNVQSLTNIARAVENDAPVTERTLTINGAVKQPITVTLPVGVSMREAVALAGGPSIENVAYIDGGPMMGKLITTLDQPITKTTGGILALPDDHILIRRRVQSESSVLGMARSVCEQCSLCTELCPRHLIGHELPPHSIVRAMNYRQMGPSPSTVLSALTCSECAICEAYACPVEISPMRINQLLKAELRAQGARYEGELLPADPMAEHRLLPTNRLISRIELGAFNHKAPFQALNYQPEQVVIKLRQHIGGPAIAQVKVGDNVTRGQLLADMPQDALGAPVHASINGKVSAVDADAITIIQEKNHA